LEIVDYTVFQVKNSFDMLSLTIN